MRTIDLDTWPRRHHYRFFRHLPNPHYSLCVDVEAGAAAAGAREMGIPLYSLLLYCGARAANAVEQLRTRIRPLPQGDLVVVHECTHPAYTVPMDVEGEQLFGFCLTEYAGGGTGADGLRTFHQQRLRTEPGSVIPGDPAYDGADRDDTLYMSSLPGVAFHTATNPYAGPDDSAPRITFGRFGHRGATVPVALQAHHSLVDGDHATLFFQALEALLSAHPDAWPATD